MNSHTTKQFRDLFRALPKEVRATGRKSYKLFKRNPFHPSVRFKKIEGNTYSARIGIGYRAVGIMTGDDVVWFWVGSHANYDKIIGKRK